MAHLNFSYGGPSLGGGGCGGGGCGAGGSFAAPAVAGSVASLGASGGAYHGQSAPVAISFNSGGGGPSYGENFVQYSLIIKSLST